MERMLEVSLGSFVYLLWAEDEELRAAVGNQAGLEALAHRYLMPALASLLRKEYGWDDVKSF